MRTKPSHLRLALEAYTVHRPDQEQTLLAMADQLRYSPSLSICKVAEALLGITDVPGELWHDPLPPLADGERTLSVAIDRLSGDWSLTKLHKLVALRRVAWAASQLARVVEKSLDEDARSRK
jgi:hypothetical protein